MPLGPFKNQQPISSIPIDQAHEQQNAYVKGSGGGGGRYRPDRKSSSIQALDVVRP